ncbi:MAG: preprotein translocase subunit SecG [Solirubrobacteraceae bacterium]
MTFILDVTQVFISIILVFLVLMHSGKDSGLSGFGTGSSGGGSPFGGGSLVEKNLNRWTILFAVLFVVNTVVLIKVG